MEFQSGAPEIVVAKCPGRAQGTRGSIVPEHSRGTAAQPPLVGGQRAIPMASQMRVAAAFGASASASSGGRRLLQPAKGQSPAQRQRQSGTVNYDERWGRVGRAGAGRV